MYRTAAVCKTGHVTKSHLGKTENTKKLARKARQSEQLNYGYLMLCQKR